MAACCASMSRGQTSAVAVPLVLPAGLVYDAAGDLYFAELGRHQVRKLATDGTLTTAVGTGVQGFAGDGGPGSAAELDSPAAVALGMDSSLFVADTHNHRVRRVNAASGMISTVLTTRLPVALALDAAGDLFVADAMLHEVLRLDAASGVVTVFAGSGLQGSAGDGGPAVKAGLDTPSGLALNAAGDLFVSDAHNHKLRRVDHASGLITTVAANLGLPRGLVADAAGNVVAVDVAGQRVLRVDAATGAVTSIAGAGTQGFAGDGGAAVAAELDSPRAVGLAPGGLVTLADSANGRVRQVNAAGVIRTVAGLGAAAGEVLALRAPTVTVYGTGTLTATLQASAATGTVTLLDVSGTAASSVASMPLTGNVGTFDLGGLAAGVHRLQASYPGDASHGAALSGIVAVTVAQAPVTASPVGVALEYGQAVPLLTGTSTGLLARDASSVTVSFGSGAGVLSAPGSYRIAAALTGSAAGNYALSTSPAAAVLIAKAPALATLSAGLVAHVATTTAGQPSGVVTLLDGGVAVASAGLNSGGDAVFAASGLSAGTHTLQALYGGDVDFLTARSAATLVSVGAATGADFTLASQGASSVTVPAGTAAQFGFAMTPTGNLVSAVQLSVAGLPNGAMASFNPALLPPGSAAQTFVLTVSTPRAALRVRNLVWAVLLLPAFVLRRRRKAAWLGLCLLVCGCGDRVAFEGQSGAVKSYTVVVTGTATSSTGSVLVHTAAVTLGVQQL